MEDSGLNSSSQRIAVVTGGNKGIGLEICRQLASKGAKVVLTARDEQRGLEAVENLKADGLSDVLFHHLDVTDLTTIASLVDFIKTNFGKLDILVNNAGVNGGASDFEDLELEEGNSLDSVFKQSYEAGEKCISTNYYGVYRVTEALTPLLQTSTSPRIVVLSSRNGKLRFIPGEAIKKELNDISCLKEERLDELLQEYLRDFRENKLHEKGWPTNVSAYKVSKVFVSAYTRILAKRHHNFIVNCVHPGLIKTDMTWNTGELSAKEGAEGPVKLALLPDGSPSGYFYDRTEVTSYE